MKLRTLLVWVLLSAGTGLLAAGSVLGDWRTIDDETGKTKSIVTLYLDSDGKLEGRVIEILHSDRGPNPLCDNCPGERKGKPVLGMVILWGLKETGDGDWKGGQIIDPKNGKVYKAKLHLREDGRLEVRGFVGFSLLGRTQTWEPVAGS
ncbi:MAG: DUF2147 domain-containing protein [Oceanipulchritudo sp.]